MTTGFYAEAIRRCSCNVQSAARYGKQRFTELYGVFRYRYGKIMFEQEINADRYLCAVGTVKCKLHRRMIAEQTQPNQIKHYKDCKHGLNQEIRSLSESSGQCYTTIREMLV